jgi:hypothetical protein
MRAQLISQWTVRSGMRPSTYHTGPDIASASLRTQRRYAAQIRSTQLLDAFEGFENVAGTGHTVRSRPVSPSQAGLPKPLPLRQQTLQQALLCSESGLGSPVDAAVPVPASDQSLMNENEPLLRSASPNSSQADSCATSPERSRAPSPENLQSDNEAQNYGESGTDETADVLHSIASSELPRLRMRKRALSTVSSNAENDDAHAALFLVPEAVSHAIKSRRYCITETVNTTGRG